MKKKATPRKPPKRVPRDLPLDPEFRYKEEAADFLEVSVRTLIRYMDQGKIPVYKQTLKGEVIPPGPQQKRLSHAPSVLRFDDLKTLKEQTEQTARQQAEQKQLKRIKPEKRTNSLVKHEPPLRSADVLKEIVQSLASFTRPAPASLAAPGVPVSDLLTLSLKQAVELSGLPYSEIDSAIKAGRLKASKHGRGRRIKRADLNAWIAKL